MGHDGDLAFRVFGYDLIQRMSHASKEGQALLAAWELETQVAAILPKGIDIRHRLAEALKRQAADLAKVYLP
jgi:hypothetical protein